MTHHIQGYTTIADYHLRLLNRSIVKYLSLTSYEVNKAYNQFVNNTIYL